MNLKTICLMVSVCLLCAAAANAQSTTTSTWEDRFKWQSGEDKYYANEFQIDAFGSYSAGFNKFNDMFDRSWRHGKFGGGVGVNYFFMRYAGIGADTFFYDSGEFWKDVSGSLYLRYPIGNTGLSPYIFGGGGRRFYPEHEWTEHAGVGLEYRFNRYTGLFGDVRYTWTDKTQDYSLVRVGVRINFGGTR